MLSYKQHERYTNTTSKEVSTLNNLRSSLTTRTELASSNIAHGYSRLRSLNVNVRRSSSLQSIQNATPDSLRHSPAPGPSSTTAPIARQESPEEISARKSRELAEDKVAVELELSRYEAASVVSSFESTGMVNIVEFWSVSIES